MSALKASLFTLVIIALGWIFWHGFSDSPTVTTAAPAQPVAVNALQQRINELEQQILELQARNVTIEQRLQALEQASKAVHTATLTPSDTRDQPDAHRGNTDLPRKVLKRPPTLAQKLSDAGLPDDTVQRIRERIGQNRLALLELRNRAIREGWIDSTKYFEKAQALGNPALGLREQEGDAVYDQYLYAAGRANRVLVSEVYAGSAAEQAGIQSGDMIIGYAQQKVYSMQDLQQATTDGRDGEMVLVELKRDSQIIDTSVPRGPLGIAMTATREKPQQ